MSKVIRRRRYALYKADAFDWLKGRRPNTVHAVVTDPPYAVVEYSPNELRKHRNGKGGIWRIPNRNGGWNRIPTPRFTVLTSREYDQITKFHSRLAPLLLKALVPGAHVIMASHALLSYLVVAEFVDAGFELRGQIARVVKTLRGGDRPKGAHNELPFVSVTPRGCWEPWLIFRKPCEGRVRDNLIKWGTGALRRPEVDKPFVDLIVSKPASPSERAIAPHPSLKPQSFIRRLVRAALPLDRGLLLDPFMGSGSTIAAASVIGFRSIGIERDSAYFKMAVGAIPRLSAFTPPADDTRIK